MKRNKGITLIALIITIIVMLILVAVSISVALNTGLFKSASDATKNWKTAQEEESKMPIEIGGKKYDSIEDYMEEINPTIVEGNIEDWGYDVESDGTLTITEYKNQDKTIDTVVIPNYIGGKPVKRVQELKNNGTDEYRYTRWYTIWNATICGEEYYYFGSSKVRMNSTVKKVIISEGIENIGAFTATESLSEVKIPDTVVNIVELSFMYCKSLKNIEIPNSVKSIGNSAFEGCTELIEITIPSSVTTMGFGVFCDIPSITVHVPWKEGEKPDGWNDNWNSTNTNCKIEVVYAGE